MGAPDFSSQYGYARLKRYLASDEPNSNGWFDAFCPLHDDSKRSAGFNFEKGVWSCRRNCGSGSIKELLNRLDARDEGDFIADDSPAAAEEDDPNSPFVGISTAEIIGLQDRSKRRQNRPIPSDETIEGWTLRLRHDSKKLLAFKERRGLTNETITRFEIGWSDDDNAYTIPIRDVSGSLLNIRLYRIEAQGTKMWSYGSKGMDANAIYPEKILAANSSIVIGEGEWDAMMLNQNGIAAITGTTGAEQWQRKWNQKFKGKDVYFAYDRDKAGVAGAEKAARSLTGVARSIYIIELPMPYRENHGLDVSDYFNEGNDEADFKALIRDARIFAAPKDGEPIEVSVRESFNGALAGKPMSMTVSIVGKSDKHGLLAREVSFTCSMNADEKCSGCPMKEANGSMVIEIAADHPVILKIRDVTEMVRDEALRRHIGASKCGKMETYVKSQQTTELLVCRTSLDYSFEEEGDGSQRTAINVGGYATETNRVAKLTGTTYSDPKDQSSVFQVWKVEPVESSLDTYEASLDEIEMMKMFVPKRGQAPLNKMKEIALDLADNVTRIVGRTGLHMAMDLVWHSIIGFDFAGQPIEKGWLELVVVGDARTGKSEIATKLSRHYGFGRVVSCESASIPGLLGAVKPMPGEKGWVLEWGEIPLNDRRLIVMDEAGGLSTDQIGQLSSLRSSGKAEVHKAVRHETHARTRLIWLSNPRDNINGMSGFMYGVQALQPLIGNQEDIARFDFAMSVATDDVSLEAINTRNLSPRPHVHSAAASHALLRWAWSRRRDDVVWEWGAEDEVYKCSLKIGREYVPDPPLIQGQNIRMKIARLAVAIAARTFSTDPTYTKVIVTKLHVQSAVEFLDYIYGLEGFGYREISDLANRMNADAISRMDEIKEYLYTRPDLPRFLKAARGQFRSQQLREQLNYSEEESNMVIQKLARASMIESADQWTYRIKPHLNTILKEIKER